MAEPDRDVQYRLDLAGSGDRRMRRACRQVYARDMSLAQIEYFVAVAEAGHVGRAARKLHVAQPAVSRQIRKLEDELRASLFHRTHRGMRLSEAGALFLHHAREILGKVAAAKLALATDGANARSNCGRAREVPTLRPPPGGK